MNTIFVIAFATLLWFCALLQGTGLGNLIDITGKVHLLLLGISFLLIMHQQFEWKAKKKPLVVWLGVILIFVVEPYFTKYQTDGVGYLLVFLVVYIMSQFNITEKCIKWIAWIYGALGALFLLIYNETTILSKWNENSIAMIAFFSYSIWIMGMVLSKQKWKKVISVFVAGLYLYLLEKTEARSSILFVIIGLLLLLDIVKIQKIISSKWRKILLCVPLIVVILCILISQTPIYEYLEIWSYKNFQKPIFNGRELLWADGFEIMFRSPFFGTGKIENYWHNSAITCLVAYGVFGFVLWISLFDNIVGKGQKFMTDRYTYGSIVAFFLIYLQQSVELGLIATNPNFIPYVALGIMMGRVKYLNQHKTSGGAGWRKLN